jgi:hypothetical protein
LKSLLLEGAPQVNGVAFDPKPVAPLDYVSLVNTALSDAGMRFVLKCPTIKSLAVNGTSQWNGSGFDASSESNVETLRLHAATIAAEHAPHFGRFPRLKALIADDSILTSAALGLAEVKTLESLEINTATTLEPASQLKSLTSVYLYNATRLAAEEYRQLAKLPKLVRLQAHEANFTPEHFALLVDIAGTHTLQLQAGQTTRSALDDFAAKAPHWKVILDGCAVK